MGGGGGNNNAMMMMMMQQQAAQEERARVEAAAQREYNEKRDAVTRQDTLAAQEYQRQQQAQQRNDEIARQTKAEELAARTRQEDYDRRLAEQQAARQREIDDRNYQESLAQQARDREAQAAAAAAAKTQTEKQFFDQSRDNVKNFYMQDAEGRLAALGLQNDSGVRSALMAALNGAAGMVPQGATNIDSYFNGVNERVLGQQQSARQTQYLNQLNGALPTDFQNSKVADTVDDSILEAILGEQFDSSAADAKRLLDRGVITQEGYDANLKQLGQQKNTGRARLTTLGNNEIASQRGKLANIANMGRSAASQYQFGQTFDPNKYVNDVNSAYDTWMKGLDSTLRGVAPTDLFDTSGFLNTAGRISGATNSPFVGSNNALTGENALTDTDEKKKKTGDASMSAIGVF